MRGQRASASVADRPVGVGDDAHDRAFRYAEAAVVTRVGVDREHAQEGVRLGECSRRARVLAPLTSDARLSYDLEAHCRALAPGGDVHHREATRAWDGMDPPFAARPLELAPVQREPLRTHLGKLPSLLERCLLAVPLCHLDPLFLGSLVQSLVLRFLAFRLLARYRHYSATSKAKSNRLRQNLPLVSPRLLSAGVLMDACEWVLLRQGAD